MPDAVPFPLVTVVTPCLNSGRYLEATIESVLAQDYPNIEYFVLDGGSTDNTPEILARYSGELRAIVERDTGTADALNKGLARARGVYFAYLCADDVLLPHAISAAAEALHANKTVPAVYGRATWIDPDGNLHGDYPTRPFDRRLLESECFICQPATLMRTSAVRQAGGFRTRLQASYDYDLWLRLTTSQPMLYLDTPLAQSRVHRDTKTLGIRRTVFRENIQVLLHNTGYAPFSHVYSLACHKLDGRDQFYQPLEPSLAKFAFSLPLGLRYNTRHPFRYCKQWASTITIEGMKRRWNQGWFARVLGLQVRS